MNYKQNILCCIVATICTCSCILFTQTNATRIGTYFIWPHSTCTFYEARSLFSNTEAISRVHTNDKSDQVIYNAFLCKLFHVATRHGLSRPSWQLLLLSTRHPRICRLPEKGNKITLHFLNHLGRKAVYSMHAYCLNEYKQHSTEVQHSVCRGSTDR
jgi:hypothetical protein